MVMFDSKSRLFIFPTNPEDSVESDRLRQLLVKIGFLGGKDGYRDEENHHVLRFQTGDKFLLYICFLGCSPDIELEPQNDKPYIYIEISQPTDAVQFISGVNVKIPCCVRCKTTLTKLPQLLTTREKLTNIFNCKQCDVLIDPYLLNWRKSAFFARTKFAVANIYESEAVPDDQLLTTLEKETGFSWKYAYVRSA